MKYVALSIIVGILLIRVILYRPLIKYLEGETSNPHGFIGKILTVIWSDYFKNLGSWGLSQIDISKFNTILDVGFGGGYNIKYIKEHNDEAIIYGIDISEKAKNTTEKLNQKYVDFGKVILSVNDVAALNFEDNKFDLVVASQTHIFWDELERGLSECLRVLKTDGILLLICEIEKIAYYLPEYNRHSEFSDLLYKIGFTDVTLKASGNYVAFISVK